MCAKFGPEPIQVWRGKQVERAPAPHHVEEAADNGNSDDDGDGEFDIEAELQDLLGPEGPECDSDGGSEHPSASSSSSSTTSSSSSDDSPAGEPAQAVAVAAPEPPVPPLEAEQPQRQRVHQADSFVLGRTRFTFKPEKTFQVTCPIHDPDQRTKCTKTGSWRLAEDRADVLLRLKSWVLQAHDHDSKASHQGQRMLPAPLAAHVALSQDDLDALVAAL